ncbi:RagB/SusD family nutrient uptake outer membrane protein [Flammeovirga sp. EKP202]|uniref:RagB/SusD family nutrient uptake outer membrane protein n=1 Tax=Flammeovirga sp. EKP202 TaxID=2770592 RepID=UPI00165F31E8|nr:RagB/SusD family nutrient uptake outer membrane protein [Flammeovirga sp. EKP202]MBD0402803.1 RagB/SusD family nutrient uptake outer membrane protein [Flammeovirga sp. EKP202]
MNFKKYIVLFITATTLVACSEAFLNRPPEDAITEDSFYKSEKELKMATAGLYNVVWFDYNDKANFAIGDGGGGNFATNDAGYDAFWRFAVTGTNYVLAEAWRSLFTVVGQANSVIRNVNEKADESIPMEAKNQAIAEARFMRGVAYLQLALLWREVPIIEDNVPLISNPIIPKNTTSNVFQFVINDLTFAADHLPETDEPGRVTKWSAKGMLAKAYLYRSGVGQTGSRSQDDLNMAKLHAGDVIRLSGLELMDNYADLYKIENNNSPESLFAFQWIFNGGWGTQNTHQAYLAPEGKLTGVGDGWGSGGGAAPSIKELYEVGDERRKATFMYKGDFYPELMKSEGGYLYELETYPAASSVKKYVVGSPDDNDGQVAFMRTSLNTYMLRLSEVYLIYAEAAMGNNAFTSDADALQYYNAVRERAGLDGKSAITWMDIFNERRVEFAMEGHFWYDLSRWSFFDPQAVVDYLSTQERGSFSWTDGNPVLESRTYNVIESDLIMPYPEADVVNNPLLKEAAVEYNFE